MKKLFLMIFIAPILTGCVGYVITDNNASYAEDISDSERPYLGIEGAELNHPKNGTQTYNNKTQWCGLTILAIIPIPLMLPVCSSRTEVVFKNYEPVRKVEHYVGQGHGAICGPLLPLIPYGDGSGSGFCRDH